MKDRSLVTFVMAMLSSQFSCGHQHTDSASSYAGHSQLNQANEFTATHGKDASFSVAKGVSETNATDVLKAGQDEARAELHFELTSPNLKSGEWLDKKYDCAAISGGQNIMPALTWKKAPPGTKSFALTLYDKDSTTGGGFWNGIIYNIPVNADSLPGGKNGGVFPAGTVMGLNDLGERAYAGPCPPSDRQHRYVFTMHALKVEKLDETALKDAGSAYLAFKLSQNDLATATFEVKAGQPLAKNKEIEETPNFTLKAEGMTPGQTISPEQYASKELGFGCDGKSVMPKLTWTAGPEGTKAYAVTFYHKDVPPTGSSFWHRVVYDIPSSVTSLPGGSGGGVIPPGAVEGKTDLGEPGFYGPCPPPGHRYTYVYTVYALSDLIGSAVNHKSPAFVGVKIFEHALAKATFEVKAGPRIP